MSVVDLDCCMKYEQRRWATFNDSESDTDRSLNRVSSCP